MSKTKNLYLSLIGIPTDAPNQYGELYFVHDPQGCWYPNQGNRLNEIDTVCVRLHDGLIQLVFGSLDSFYEVQKKSPEFLSSAGMNSEAKISRYLFNQLLEKIPSDFPLNKYLYLCDCRKIVSSLQECIKEVMQLQGEFYRTLNLEDLFYPKIREDDGLRYVTSPVVTKLYSLFGTVYIRMYSILDYITKLAIEIENLRLQFDSYPRLASKNSQYGDRKRVSFNNRTGTLFEKCQLLTEIENVRNHLIHDGLLDEMPKVYRVISNGKCVEKFLLFPDQDEDGRFMTYKNRNLFYYNENKINYRLPNIVQEFQKRLLLTLEMIVDKINNPQY